MKNKSMYIWKKLWKSLFLGGRKSVEQTLLRTYSTL